MLYETKKPQWSVTQWEQRKEEIHIGARTGGDGGGGGGEWEILSQKSGHGSIKKLLLTRKKEIQILGIQEGELQQVAKTKDMGNKAHRNFLER